MYKLKLSFSFQCLSKRKILTIGFIFLFHGQNLQSQQLYQLSQYMLNPFQYNPASSASNENISVFASGRNQWMDFKDNKGQTVQPRNLMTGLELPLHSLNSGLGFQYQYYKLGYQSGNDFKVSYAYHINIQQNQKLSLGIYGQLSQIQLNIDKLIPLDSLDPLILKTGQQKKSIPTTGIGIQYSSGDLFQFGLSLFNALGKGVKLGNIDLEGQMTAVAQTAFKIKLINERRRKFSLNPSALIKSNFTSTQFEINMLGYFNEQYWLGAGYRYQDGMIFLTGIKYQNLVAGLSYDLTTSRIAEATGKGSAEIYLSYSFSKNKSGLSKQNSIRNTRNGRKISYESGFNTRHL